MLRRLDVETTALLNLPHTDAINTGRGAGLLDAGQPIGTLGVEMEAAGLYTIAAELGKEALAVLTVSDLLFDPSRDMTAEERESKFSKALNIAAAAAVG